jgi:tetratricopeptide (TPR) repeat protein
MKARIPIILMICAALIISIISSHAETADSEALGLQAESEGRLRAALTHYIDALQSVTEASDRDLELRKAIIKLSLKLQPPPAIPDAVFEYEGRGEAAMQAQAYNDAVKEYKKVLLLAPWFAGYYYNLATAL